jgi:hypothetical protein
MWEEIPERNRGVKELPRAETVLASCVFSTAPSAMRVKILRRCYGAAQQVGGSGVDLRLRLAPDIEAQAPDYSLYPELGDRALGFLTRGCPRRCPFCVVPVRRNAVAQLSLGSACSTGSTNKRPPGDKASVCDMTIESYTPTLRTRHQFHHGCISSTCSFGLDGSNAERVVHFAVRASAANREMGRWQKMWCRFG